MNEYYMQIALKEALKSYKKDDVPVGAIIVKNGKIIAKAHNQKEQKRIATLHAEIIAINKACKKLKTWHLNDCIMYVTLEPCLMCVGAIAQARLQKVVYGCDSPKFGAIDLFTTEKKKMNHFPTVEKGILNEKAQEILKKFFEEKRKKK